MLNLVFIHEAGDDHRIWQRQREFFAGSHAVLDVDLPGRDGRAGEPPFDSHEDNARDVLGRMDASRMTRAVLIGHSAGGAVAITMALESPERVHALVLVATGARLPVNPDILDAARRRAEGAGDAPARPVPLEAVVGPSIPPERLRWLAERTMTAPPQTVYADLRANARFDAEKRVPTISAPTLVIGCGGDRLVPVSLSESLAASIPGAQLVILPNCGHYPQVEQESVFTSTLAKFLGRLPAHLSLTQMKRAPLPPSPSVG